MSDDHPDRGLRDRLLDGVAAAFSFTGVLAVGYVTGYIHGETGYDRAAPNFMLMFVAVAVVVCAVFLLVQWRTADA